jgi:hypothetical protein
MLNTEEAAAWSAVPEITHAETALSEMEARVTALGDVASPDEARDQVFASALDAVIGGKPYPKDVGKAASKAYLSALETESEALAVRTVAHGLKAHLTSLKLANAGTALEALGARFDGFMAEVRAAVAELDGAQSAEAAVMKGGKASDAWRLLTSMVGHLRAIRTAQYSILRLDAGDGPAVLRLRGKGLFEVRDIDISDVPAGRLRALTEGLYDVPYLLFLAGQDGAWVPGDFEELRAQDTTPEYGVPDGPVRDYSPTVTPIPASPETVRRAHERTPDLQLN